MSNILLSLSTSILLLFPLFISMAAQSNEPSYPNCPTYNCAEITISYPFWRMDSESPTQFCGYQGFGIRCNVKRDIQIATLGNESYYVSKINYRNKSIVVTDYDVYPVVLPNTCPRVCHNLETLPFNVLDPNVNVNLSFHYNCTTIPNFATEIPCLRSGTNKSCVNDLKSEPPNFRWDEYSCDGEVVSMVLDTLQSRKIVGSNIPGENITIALQWGIELRWGRMEDCEKCEDSSGHCGYNQNLKEFRCFCVDGTTSKADCNGVGYISIKKGSNSSLQVKFHIL